MWDTHRRFTVDSAEINALVLEGETPTVDLRRQLELGTPARNAELVKDVIALANTKASGPRYLLIGFTDDGDYYAPSDADERVKRDRLLEDLNQDRLQSIISSYTSPAVKVRYTEVTYRAGRMGRLEFLRDPTEVPYAVSNRVRKLKKGHGFHGTWPSPGRRAPRKSRPCERTLSEPGVGATNSSPKPVVDHLAEFVNLRCSVLPYLCGQVSVDANNGCVLYHQSTESL